VTDSLSLQHYTSLGCQVILGTLYITDAGGISDAEFQLAFGEVTSIQGSLVVSNSASLTSLRSFSALQHVIDITLVNNAYLVDAHLPRLTSYGTVTVTNCERLCPSRYPGAAPYTPQASGCVNIQASQLFAIVPTGGQDVEAVIQRLLSLEVAAETAQYVGCVSAVRQPLIFVLCSVSISCLIECVFCCLYGRPRSVR
jgi:hypothetical protein